MDMHVREVLGQLAAGRTLTHEESRAAFEILLTGRMEAAQVAGMLSLMAARKPTVDELVGASEAMRAHVTPVPLDIDSLLRRGVAILDTCGTGGTPKTFNVSTIAAIVVAAAAPGRVIVAKHGNRSRTGRGSAEVLKGLGVNVDASPRVQAKCAMECGVCFCFAIHHHPAMRFAGPVRQALGFPTILNLAGPLTNPAGATHQLMGVYDESLRGIVAQALARLRCRRAWVMHSEDGLDEISINARTRVSDVVGGGVAERVVDPGSLGIAPVSHERLAAEDVADAVRIGRELLGGLKGARREMLLLNAGAALLVCDVVKTLEDGMAMCGEAIDRGAALATLDALVRLSQE